jgi:hypothetical protein
MGQSISKPTFCIEAHIPLHPERRGVSKYPWRQMKVGDSFLVPGKNQERLLNCLTSCRANAQRSTGWKFSLRCTTFGVRVWRTK